MSNSIMKSAIYVNLIYETRGVKVMLDSDLAILYNVSTSRLNEQVKRNHERFPEDFMFQLTNKEFINLKSQNATSSWGGRRTLPFVFTEYGVSMLSSVLNSKQAIKVNIEIMRTFGKIREYALSNKELFDKIKELERKYNGQFNEVFKALNELRLRKSEMENRKLIGFKGGRNK